MLPDENVVPLHGRLVEALYREALALADEAQSYFDVAEHGDRRCIDPLARITFSCESLKVTTRLTQVVAWLLTQRAGEGAAGRMRGVTPVTEAAVLAAMPPAAQTLIVASIALYRRAEHLDRVQGGVFAAAVPASRGTTVAIDIGAALPA